MTRHSPSVIQSMVFSPDRILEGQWWRLFSFVLIPKGIAANPIWIFFELYILYMMATALENQWGSFRFTLYYLTGILCHVCIGLSFYLTTAIPLPFDGWYQHLSVFLAFAWLFPDFVLYLFFVLPVKMRWLAWLTGIWIIWNMVTGGWLIWTMTAAGLGNYLLFFGPSFFRNLKNHRQTIAARNRLENVAKAETVTIKCCSQCSKTAQDADIRLCTCAKCGEDGRFWCTDHLQH